MTLKDFFEDCLSLDACARRIEQEDYIELVLRREAISQYICSLDSMFGSPAKPEGVRPSWRLSRAAKKYGGIKKNQTLYLHNDMGEKFMAMLWPWQDGEHATLKLIWDRC